MSNQILADEVLKTSNAWWFYNHPTVRVFYELDNCQYLESISFVSKEKHMATYETMRAWAD